jgi:hypothetical protein
LVTAKKFTDVETGFDDVAGQLLTVPLRDAEIKLR